MDRLRSKVGFVDSGTKILGIRRIVRTCKRRCFLSGGTPWLTVSLIVRLIPRGFGWRCSHFLKQGTNEGNDFGSSVNRNQDHEAISRLELTYFDPFAAAALRSLKRATERNAYMSILSSWQAYSNIGPLLFHGIDADQGFVQVAGSVTVNR